MMPVAAEARAPAVGALPVQPAGRSAGTLAKILTVFGGNVGATLLGFVTNIWAMHALGPEQYGVLSVALVVLYVVWQFTGKGLDQTAVCLGRAAGDAQVHAQVFGTACGLKLASCALLLVLGLGLAGPLTRVLVSGSASAVPVMLAFVGATGASLWGFVSAALQSESRFGPYALVQVTSGAVKLAGMACAAAVGALGVNSLMLATAAGFFGAAALGVWLGPRYAWRPRWDTATVPAMLRFARWTVLSSVFYLLYSRLDVLLLGRMCGGPPVGVYAAALALIQVVDLVTASAVTVFLPGFSSETAPGALRAQVRRALTSSLLLALPLAPGYFLIDPGVSVLVRIVGPGYAGIAPLLKIMYFGVLFAMVTHPLHILYYARGKPHLLTALDGVMLLLIAGGHYVAIAQAGPLGAAWVVLGARVLLGLVLLVGVWRELGTVRRAARE